jgi:hypothetical protein
MYITTTEDTAIANLVAAIGPSALFPLFAVASQRPQVAELAAAAQGGSDATPAKASNECVAAGRANTQPLTANCATTINALLTQVPAGSPTVTDNGSQAAIDATQAMYESLQRFWLTAKGLDGDMPARLNADALAQAAKPFSPLELIACLNAIFQYQPSRESKETASNLLKFGAITMDDDRRVVTVSGTPVELRPMDYKLLRFLMLHPERVFSRAQLLDKVWGGHAFVEERTVDTHVMNLRKSIGQCSHYVKTVHSVGYVLRNG